MPARLMDVEGAEYCPRLVWRGLAEPGTGKLHHQLSREVDGEEL